MNTIAREPLTVAELETLAIMLDSGTRKMSTVRTEAGGWAWPQGRILSSAWTDTFEAFYAIRNDSFAFGAPGSDIRIGA